MEQIIQSRTENILKQNEELELQKAQLKRSFQETQIFKQALDQHSLLSMTDEKGQILYVNENFLTKLGYEEKEVLGNTHALFSSGEHDKEFWDKMMGNLIHL